MDPNQFTKAVAEAIPTLQAHTLARLHEAIELVERGEYAKASGEITTAQARLGRLVWVEHNVMPFSESMVVKVKDLSAGMELKEWGTLADMDIESIQCQGGGQHQHSVATLRFESGLEVNLDPDDEVMLVGQRD